MGDNTWHQRWKSARARHFSSAEKLWERVREEKPTAARSTVLAWEGVPAKKASYPSPAYRAVLAGVNEEFAALIREVEERERAKDDLTLQGLAAAHARLEETVRRLQEAVEATDRRLAALEQPPRRRASRRAQGGNGQ